MTSVIALMNGMKRLTGSMSALGSPRSGNYPRFGHNVGASLDGRLYQEAFSSNFSPAVGRDREGPTAVLLSTAKVDLSRLNSGCPIDLVMSFNKEKREQNRDILLGFIKSFVELGNIMTITRVDLATLKKAQLEPEKYRSLRVRLGGLTAYFVQLARPQQDEYMRRTAHQMWYCGRTTGFTVGGKSSSASREKVNRWNRSYHNMRPQSRLDRGRGVSFSISHALASMMGRAYARSSS